MIVPDNVLTCCIIAPSFICLWQAAVHSAEDVLVASILEQLEEALADGAVSFPADQHEAPAFEAPACEPRAPEAPAPEAPASEAPAPEAPASEAPVSEQAASHTAKVEDVKGGGAWVVCPHAPWIEWPQNAEERRLSSGGTAVVFR